MSGKTKRRAGASEGPERRTARVQLLIPPSAKAEIKQAADAVEPVAESLNEFVLKAALMRARGKFRA